MGGCLSASTLELQYADNHIGVTLLHHPSDMRAMRDVDLPFTSHTHCLISKLSELAEGSEGTLVFDSLAALFVAILFTRALLTHSSLIPS